MRLSDADRERFRAEGLLVVPGELPESEVAALSEAMDELYSKFEHLEETTEAEGATVVVEPTGPGGAPRVQRIVWCGAASAPLAATGVDPRILGRAAALLGETEVDQLVNQAHFKRPGDGVTFPLHQDAWNRRHGTDLWRDDAPDGGYVQVVLAVDEMAEDNGPLVHVPGSAKAGPLLGEDRSARVAELAGRSPPVPILAPPGSLILFGPFLVHGSAPNEGARPRRALVNGYARAGVNRRRYPGAGLGVRRRP